MQVYLAGPMRGYPEFNFPAFKAAAKDLRSRGIGVFSPAERDVKRDHFDPAHDAAKPMSHYMQFDLPAVCRRDGVVNLPGWEDSQGACLENFTAAVLGKSIFAYKGEGQPLVPIPGKRAMRVASRLLMAGVR